MAWQGCGCNGGGGFGGLGRWGWLGLTWGAGEGVRVFLASFFGLSSVSTRGEMWRGESVAHKQTLRQA